MSDKKFNNKKCPCGKCHCEICGNQMEINQWREQAMRLREACQELESEIARAEVLPGQPFTAPAQHILNIAKAFDAFVKATEGRAE